MKTKTDKAQRLISELLEERLPHRSLQIQRQDSKVDLRKFPHTLATVRHAIAASAGQ